MNNGKYCNGGMIINPFASINDGLVDITWISDPAWQGSSGVSSVISDSRGGGGIQVYKGHSQYVRGRKIRIDVPQPEGEQPNLELAPEDAPQENGEGEEVKTPATTETGNEQIIVIDGEVLSYSNSVQWECFPSNIEVLIDEDYFAENSVFVRKITEQVEKDRIYRLTVEKIWKKYDLDESGQLDKDETRKFL